jgi:hypothetical protein
MITRRAMACIAALAAALSVGALGYAVLWAFDLDELVRPAAQPPHEAKQEARQETKRPTPRRKAVVIVASRVPGEDVGEVAARAPHATPFGGTLAVAAMRATDEPSALIAVAPPPTPRTPGEDVGEIAARAPHAMPFGDTVAVAPMRATDEPSAFIAVPPPTTPPTPGEDAPAIAASARVSIAAAAVDRTISDDMPARSDLMPQQEATVPPIETLPDPEPTGAVQRAPLILQVPEPQVAEPQVTEPEER